jgi:cell division protein ZapA (FtsZ GTPase activity inhibitor)
MKNSIEIIIGNQRYVLQSEESEEHLREVAEMVRRRVESLKKKSKSLSAQKAAILTAFDFASEVIKLRRRSADHKGNVVAKAQELLHKIEIELDSRPQL